MRKVLFGLGIVGIAGSLYWYFKKQLELALSYNYNVDDIKIISLTTESAIIEADITLENKSSFEIDILRYDIEVFYKDVQVARTASENQIKILADNKIKLKAQGKVIFDEIGKVVLPFAMNVLQQKPINVSVKGFVTVEFLGIEHTIKIDEKNIQYSSNLLEEYGLAEKWEKLKQKLPFLNKIK